MGGKELAKKKAMEKGAKTQIITIKENEKKKIAKTREKDKKTVKKQKEDVVKIVKKAKVNKKNFEQAERIEVKLGRLAKLSVQKAKKVTAKVHEVLDKEAGD